MEPNDSKNSDDARHRCFVGKCPCGAFHLHYRYVMVVITKQTLFQIMEECYRWEESRASVVAGSGSSSPMIIMLGIVSLVIPEKDFGVFSKAIHNAVSKELGLEALIGQA